MQSGSAFDELFSMLREFLLGVFLGLVRPPLISVVRLLNLDVIPIRDFSRLAHHIKWRPRNHFGAVSIRWSLDFEPVTRARQVGQKYLGFGKSVHAGVKGEK